ncbi:MAG: glycosyltransferase [Rudaea sp.]
MRVLHIGKFYPPHAGGIEHFSADLVHALAGRGVATAMLAHASPGEDRRAFNDDGVEVVLAACRGQLFYAPVSPSFPIQLARMLARFRPELLHLHLPNTSAFWALLSPAARALPWVIHWHADIPLDARSAGVRALYRVYRPWEQALLRRARAVIATSAAYRDASTSLAAWHDKIRVIPLGLGASSADEPVGAGARDESSPDGVASARVHWPAAGVRVLAVGRLSYYKGFDVLLRAIAQLPQASLLLIGGGECEASLRELARELGIEARVRFAGVVDDASLRAAYSRAQIFCLPSIERSEAFGLVLLEAMRARLPVVASAISGSGVGFVVAASKTGLLTPPGDAPALARALGTLAADASARTQMGAAGHARWREEFTLDRCVQQILALYRSL